ncbi:hypothetical protein ACJQWK_02878 [Exserohilum turcicum]
MYSPSPLTIRTSQRPSSQRDPARQVPRGHTTRPGNINITEATPVAFGNRPIPDKWTLKHPKDGLSHDQSISALVDYLLLVPFCNHGIICIYPISPLSVYGSFLVHFMI